MTSYFLRVFGAMVLALLVSAALYSFVHAAPYSWTSPPSSVEMRGYAWSDNIGWISFNCDNHDISTCTDYKVEINDDGTLSGHAWSDNIGWIQFGGLGTAPGSNGDAHLEEIGSDLFIYGWARACSVFVSGCSGALRSSLELGGWDGWISFNCADSSSCGTSGYGPLVGNTTMSRYAWGGDVIGWVDMNMVSLDPFNTSLPVVTFEAGDPSVNDWAENLYVMADGADVALRWTAANADWCVEESGNSFDTGATRLTTGTDDVNEPVDGDADHYEIRCHNTNGDVYASVTIDNPADPNLPSVVVGAHRAGESGWSYGTFNYIVDSEIEVRWDAAYADSCTASGPGFDIVGTIGGVDGDVTEPTDNGTETYSVTCTNTNGPFTASVVVSNQPDTTVPTLSSFTAEPYAVRSGESVSFSWTVTNTNICQLRRPDRVVTTATGNETGVSSEPVYGRTEFSLWCQDDTSTYLNMGSPVTIQVVAAYEEN